MPKIDCWTKKHKKYVVDFLLNSKLQKHDFIFLQLKEAQRYRLSEFFQNEDGYSINLIQTEKKKIFRPFEVSNGPVAELFQLERLQMILPDCSISDSLRATRSAHTRWPKFRIW